MPYATPLTEAEIDAALKAIPTWRREGDWLILHVRDNGPGMPEADAEASDGLGLKITRARLEQLYGKQQVFSIQNRSEGGVDISIRIPFRTDIPKEQLQG